MSECCGCGFQTENLELYRVNVDEVLELCGVCYYALVISKFYPHSPADVSLVKTMAYLTNIVLERLSEIETKLT